MDKPLGVWCRVEARVCSDSNQELTAPPSYYPEVHLLVGGSCVTRRVSGRGGRGETHNPPLVNLPLPTVVGPHIDLFTKLIARYLHQP